MRHFQWVQWVWYAKDDHHMTQLIPYRSWTGILPHLDFQGKEKLPSRLWGIIGVFASFPNETQLISKSKTV